MEKLLTPDWAQELAVKFGALVRNSVPEIIDGPPTDVSVRGYGSKPIAQSVVESPQGKIIDPVDHANQESLMGTTPPKLDGPTNYQLQISTQFEPEFTVSVKEFKTLLADLRARGFVHLADLTAYDEHPQKPRFQVVYELISLKEKSRCAIIVPLEMDDPKIETVTDLWAGANWLEREVYDMYGIVFENHPDMRRILLPNSFKGYPLRKDFVVDYRQEFDKSLAEEGLFDPFGNTLVRGKTQS